MSSPSFKEALCHYGCDFCSKSTMLWYHLSSREEYIKMGRYVGLGVEEGLKEGTNVIAAEINDIVARSIDANMDD